MRLVKATEKARAAFPKFFSIQGYAFSVVEDAEQKLGELTIRSLKTGDVLTLFTRHLTPYVRTSKIPIREAHRCL